MQVKSKFIISKRARNFLFEIGIDLLGSQAISARVLRSFRLYETVRQQKKYSFSVSVVYNPVVDSDFVEIYYALGDMDKSILSHQSMCGKTNSAGALFSTVAGIQSPVEGSTL